MRKNGYVLRRCSNEDFPYWQGEAWVASIQEAWLFVDYADASESCGDITQLKQETVQLIEVQYEIFSM